MFSSEKVLQMSYANYQYVLAPSLFDYILIHSAEAKKLWSRNSKTLASWMSARLGGPRSSTPNQAPSRESQSLSQRPHIFVGRSAEHTNAEHSMSLASAEGLKGGGSIIITCTMRRGPAGRSMLRARSRMSLRMKCK